MRQPDWQTEDGAVRLYCGDCREVLPTMPESHYHSCVTDPPYELGFMGRAWDRSGVAFLPETWEEVYRVLRPGAHLLAFGGSRTFHRLAVAIEDAGFEIRDDILELFASTPYAADFLGSLTAEQVKLFDRAFPGSGLMAWLFGSGFPKSLDVSKAIDKAAGIWRGKAGAPTRAGESFGQEYARNNKEAPATEAAKQWDGWASALKPAFEPIILARKPLDGTIAANVLKWGCGALNIGASRVPHSGESLGGGRVSTTTDGWDRPWKHDDDAIAACRERGMAAVEKSEQQGRYPANVLHDGSPEVVGMFPETGCGDNRGQCNGTRPSGFGNVGNASGDGTPNAAVYPDSGSAARFFWSPKASRDERPEHTTDDGRTVRHPTVKPLELIRYLVRLITPPGGTILEPFTGSGTTLEAAWLGHWPCDGIELHAEHIPLIASRMTERIAELPLFEKQPPKIVQRTLLD